MARLNAHIERILRCRTLPELMPFFRTANDPAKELTESFGIFSAVTRLLGEPSLGADGIVCLCPGDGKLPRTGAMVALMSRWTVISIDPMMKSGRAMPERLSCYRGTVQEFLADDGAALCNGAALVVILAVHSHALLEALWGAIAGPKVCLAMPCCVPQVTGEQPAAEFEDMDVLSPCRRILVWDGR